MYVCLCKQVTDRQIEQAIANGARCMRDLSTELGVATGCGRCASYAKSMLQDSCCALTSPAAQSSLSLNNPLPA